MKFIVVEDTERDGELIADLLRETARLGEGDVMGMARRALADETRFAGNEGAMGFAAQAPLAGDEKLALVDGKAAGDLGAAGRDRGFGTGGELSRGFLKYWFDDIALACSLLND